MLKNTTHIKRVLRPFKDFLSRQNLFKVLLHIALKEIIQSLKTCSTILRNMSDTLSKEYCIHLRTFFTDKTLSKYYYCIYWCILLHRNSTFFYNMPWPQLFYLFYAMCPVLFESNIASNEGLSLQVRFFQSPAASMKAFCYKAMLHVLKEIPHHSPQGIQKCFPGT